MQPPVVFFKNSQNWKKITLAFNSVYFSPRVNISFQLSVYHVIFLSLKNLFLHCFSTIFPFHKLQLCSHLGKFWYIYVIKIKINKKAPSLFQPPGYYISLNFPFIKIPPFIRNLGLPSAFILIGSQFHQCFTTVQHYLPLNEFLTSLVSKQHHMEKIILSTWL